MADCSIKSDQRVGCKAVIGHCNAWCVEKHGVAFVGPLIEAAIKKVTAVSPEKGLSGKGTTR